MTPPIVSCLIKCICEKVLVGLQFLLPSFYENKFLSCSCKFWQLLCALTIASDEGCPQWKFVILRFQLFQVSPWYLLVTAIINIEEDYHLNFDKYQRFVPCYVRFRLTNRLHEQIFFFFFFPNFSCEWVMPFSISTKGPSEDSPLFPFQWCYLYLNFPDLSWFHPTRQTWFASRWSCKCNRCSESVPAEIKIYCLDKQHTNLNLTVQIRYRNR